MSQTIHTLYHQTDSSSHQAKEKFALDILVGLSRTRKEIPSIYHYDAEGSRLFNRITELSEYYPTKCEIDVLRRHQDRIAELFGPGPINLIEFGPGDGSKTKILIEKLLSTSVDFRYVPIDISRAALDELVEDFSPQFPGVEISGLVADYFEGLKWLNHRYHNRNIILFMGSNIGNFSSEQAHLFLRNLWMNLNAGDIVVIGFDLKKDIDVLLKAYNDSEGVTAEFNLNLLRRINRELGGKFDLDNFKFQGIYQLFTGAVESYLISLKDQDVYIGQLDRSFHFDKWEPIHTEYSYKYDESDIERLARDTGYKLLENLYDSKSYFVDSIWQVHKPESV